MKPSTVFLISASAASATWSSWPSWASLSSKESSSRLEYDLEKGTGPCGPECTIKVDGLRPDSKQPYVAPITTPAPPTVAESVAINLGGGYNRKPDSFVDTPDTLVIDAPMSQDDLDKIVRKRGLVDGKKDDLGLDVSPSTDKDAILELLEKVSDLVDGKDHSLTGFQDNHHPTTLATVVKASATSTSVSVPTADAESKPSQADWLETFEMGLSGDIL